MQSQLDRDEMMSNWQAATMPDVLDTGVPFYGSQPPLELATRIKTPL